MKKVSGSEFAEAGDLVLLGIPADDKSSWLRGSALAPPLIRQALDCASSNAWTEDGLDLDACTTFKDAGDLALDGRFDRDAIEAGVTAFLSRGARLLCLGGDHSVTYPILRAYSRRFGARFSGGLTVLHLDAHPDLYDSFEGDVFSHACPFARCMEEGLASRLVQVGIRCMNGYQLAQARRFGVEVIDMRAWVGGARPRIEGDFYLSLDLDALDPAFAPGVSHREPGGLSTREALELLRSAGGSLVGADIVEYNPAQDPGGITSTVAAKFLKEIASRMLADGI